MYEPPLPLASNELVRAHPHHVAMRDEEARLEGPDRIPGSLASHPNSRAGGLASSHGHGHISRPRICCQLLAFPAPGNDVAVLVARRADRILTAFQDKA
jgi:hypothetical protein